MWAINLFLGLSPTSFKSTTHSSLASLSSATVSFPSEFELGELIVINWPCPPFTLPWTPQLHSVHWNLRRARPQIQLHCGPSGLGGRARGSPICWFVENIYSVEKKTFLTNIHITAKSLGDWYYFGMVSVSMNIVFVFLHPFLPESPRWLISQKRFSEAAELINGIRWNTLFVSFK